MTVSIKRTVRTRAPSLPYEQLAKHVLSAPYELSLVICGDTLSRSLNEKYRGKIYAANVLSFPLSKTEGEIFLNTRAAEREARKYGVSLRERLALLFVHGLFHLNGRKHGAAMESAEQRVLKAFDLA